MNKDKYYNIKIMNKGYGKTYHEMQQLIKHLQQESEKLKGRIEFLEDINSDQYAYIKELQQENERLEHDNIDMINQLGKIISRIYKAIEYIKANCSYDEDTNMCCDDLFCGDVDDLLNILQNGSDNDDK